MDSYRQVTDAILSQLRAGIIPWHKPFATIEGAMNYVSRRGYSALNTLLLSRPGEYITPKQAMELHGDFRGAKTETVYFFKMVEKKRAKDKDADKLTPDDTYPVLKSYRVLHISDVKGIKSKLEPTVKIGLANQRNDVIDAAVNGYLGREDIGFEQGAVCKAAYLPQSDTVTVPPPDQFVSSEAYYAALFHEMVHSTGVKERLNRDMGKTYASGAHSREELVAEIGSAMLCNHFGIDTADTLTNSAAYIQGWMQAIGADEGMVVWAAGRAEKAVRRILDIEEQQTAAQAA